MVSFEARTLHAEGVSLVQNLATQATNYQVRSGDSLALIAKKHGVTVDLLKKVNSLPNDNLMAGKTLKIPTLKLSILVDKSENRLFLLGDSDVLKTYAVSTGLNGSTPVGVFEITNKLVDPTWYHAGAVIPSGDKENQLGTRWMGITAKGYGIHGTTEPEKLGQAVSAGCVRMKNEDVEELYSLIPSRTKVTIQE